MTVVEATPGAGLRPLYGEFAWAYDYLVTRPVWQECAGMVRTLASRGLGPGARLLDAGCGNARYSIELARHGFEVTGVDCSPALLEEAEARLRVSGGATPVRLERADLLTLAPENAYDAVVCRGVLNDFVDADQRAAIFPVFARVLRPGGALLLDVRDWDATAARYTREPVQEKRVPTPRGSLLFRSETRLDPKTQRILVSERHTLTTQSGETTATYDFVMRCWTREELGARLGATGFEAAEYAATYDGAPPVGIGDRIVVAASLGARASWSA